jgi:arylsulfatase A-like enzyme
MPRIARRRFMCASAAGASLALGAGCAAFGRRGARTRPPNVLVVITDDQRWDCMGCAGHPFLKTPHLDRLAAEGARFTNAFVTTSLCSPSRATLLSGLYAHAHGVNDNFTDFPSGMPSYVKALRANGYETAYVGKWHMGEQSDAKRPGFDYWASHEGQGKYYENVFNIEGRKTLLTGYYTHRVTELATDWLARPRARPFCMIVGHKAPHTPFTPEPKYEHVFDRTPITPPATLDDTGAGKPAWIRERLRTWHGVQGPLFGLKDYDTFVRSYLATILSVDDSVGALYGELSRSGELDNTIFVFTGDNGFLLGEHGMTDKRAMHEESIRVPFLVRYPEAIDAGTRVDRMVLNTDLAPSVLGLCGAPPLPKTHGMSFAPLLRGEETAWRTSWLYEYNFEKEFPFTPNVRGVRTDDWKLIRYPNADGRPDLYGAELYRLKDDPLETKNLIDASEASATRAELETELGRLLAATGAIPDRMPLDPTIGTELPEAGIR